MTSPVPLVGTGGGAPLLTTVVGSLPKPAWLFDATNRLDGWLSSGDLLRQAQDDATRLAILDQEDAGVDILSDGEQRRESFIYYFQRHLEGFDYQKRGVKSIRRGHNTMLVPTIVAPLRRREPITLDDLRFLRAHTRRRVKMTLVGPMTLADTSLDDYYHDERALAMDAAAAINQEILDLQDAGCDVVQIDEPVFSRYPEKTAEWGIECLDRCLEGVSIATAVHICFGYPHPDRPRDGRFGYEPILPHLARSRIRQLSLEFEAPAVDVSLLAAVAHKEIIFGCIATGTNEVESPEHVAQRLREALRFIPPERLFPAPDCGLVVTSPELARAKLAAMVQGAELALRRP